MTPERYRQVCQLYHEALELTPDTRLAFFDGSCGSDEELRREVESMLKAHESAGNYFASPAMEVAAWSLSGPAMPSLAGQRLNHYQVLSILGVGGMGEVYLADDTRLERKVALKLLPAEFMRDADRVQRFGQEARAASALNHPNIITIYEIGQVDSTNYIVTEFVMGATLRQQMTNGKLTIGAALDLAAQMASALAAAHAAGIVHRDIKPENVMVRPDGLVKVLDFGLAKLTELNRATAERNPPTVNKSLTEPGQVMGSPSYMSPEQARGVGVDARSDIFSLGVVLYEMITGRPPFGGETPTDKIVSIVQQEPGPLRRYTPEAPPELEQIVATALRKDRDERYQTASELLADLKGLKRQLELEPTPAHVKGATANLSRSQARRNWLWPLAAGLIALLAVAVAVWRASKTLVQAQTPVIAVLPFKNLSPEKDSEYFAEGLTDELIRHLSIIDGLEVRSRTSSFAFKDKPYTIREVGEKLKANYVLGGTVAREGEKLRVSAQFAGVDDDKPLWADRFDKESKDVFKIQEEISLGIINQLRLKLGRGRRRYETSIDAYDLYLRAGSQAYLTDRPGLRIVKRISLYGEVIAKDPSFAPAYAELAMLHAAHSTSFPMANPDVAAAKLRDAAVKAIQLDPLLEEAHIAVGRMHTREGRWDQAEKSFLEAIRLNPNRSESYVQYAVWWLEPVGRLADAIMQLRYAEKADPLSHNVKEHLASALTSVGRYDEAEAYIKQSRVDAETGDPARVSGTLRLARLRLGQGRVAEATQLLENLPQRINNPLLRGWLGNAFARSGRREEAEQMAAVSEFANEQALIYAGLGDKDRTLAALESMGSRGPERVGMFLNYPEFGFLRGDPRLTTLRTKVGLPP